MPSAGFESLIPTSDSLQTHALDRAVAGNVQLVGTNVLWLIIYTEYVPR
jgi:hypothetical protein